MKMCEHILKKRQRPNTIQILSIVIAGQVLAYNSKDFYWLNKNRPRTEYEWIMKTISKNQIKTKKKQKTENQYKNAARDNKKSLTRNANLILTKNEAWNELWMGGKPFRKKIQSKKMKKKTVKNKVRLSHANKKPLARKRIFVQTPFPHSSSKLDQNHNTNLTS